MTEEIKTIFLTLINEKEEKCQERHSKQIGFKLISKKINFKYL